MRKILTETLNSAHRFEVIGSAQDPVFVISKMEKAGRDVITLDFEMPRMDGGTFLKKVMPERTTPILMCSTLTEEGSKASLEALQFWAADVVTKPKSSVKTTLPEASKELIALIRIAAKANLSKRTRVAIPGALTKKSVATRSALSRPARKLVTPENLLYGVKGSKK